MTQQALIPQEQTLDHILPDLRPLAVDMSGLILDPENARKHDARNIRMIAESLQMFGQRTPLTVNRFTNFIAKGNGTYMAARLLGWTVIAAVWADDDRHNAIAYGLIDNRTSDTSSTNYSQTGKHLRELSAANYPMLKFWTEEEALPLIRTEFVKPAVTDEVFDAGLQKGRAITKISATERLGIDQAIAFVRSQSRRSVTEGAALAQICGEYMAMHINELDNAVQQTMETKITALSLED